ncbi:MAG TPA: M23 family metallopeptidase [Desulfobacteria bacterium]|nr:M23 family metallopeptidase [Desulfobacteria bacterium]
MAVVVRKKNLFYKGIAVFTALLVIGSILWYRTNKDTQQREPFEKLSELPAGFVRNCQRVGDKFSVHWELLAAFYQVRIEQAQISQYPNSDEVVQLAAKLASVDKKELQPKDLANALGYPMELTEQISLRAQSLAKGTELFSKSFSFPYKSKVTYQDTWGADREGGKRKHEGTDIFAKEGVPIYSVSDGKVEKLGWNRLGGERVGIRGPFDLYYYYAHLSKINPNLSVGMSIKKGDLLGYTGHTGDAINTPDHLHFGIELNDETWINPYNFLQYWQGN